MSSVTPRTMSGRRFWVTYHVMDSADRVEDRVGDICVEQTIEFPTEFVMDADILRHVVGRIDDLRELEPGRFEARVSYPVEAVDGELPQLLNVLFGNVSLQPGIRIAGLELPGGMLKSFRGPRFGITGLREFLRVSVRSLLCTALKPMGLSSEELAEQAHQFARGGLDMVKDDHSLSNQPFSRFEERVQRCVDAVDRGNRESGNRCVYIPNVSGPGDEVIRRARFARQAGAGGLLIAPGLVGFDTMRCIADDDEISLPILSHPAFLGSMVTHPDNGLAHGLLLGTLNRLAGADVAIFPSYGGRFSFTRGQCQEIAHGLCAPLGRVESSWPAPGGGMRLERVPELVDFYGRDTILLIGGDLHSPGPDLCANSEAFRQAAIATR